MTSVVATGTPEVANGYSYDQNGNMTCRSEQGELYNQIYNAENRLWKVQKLSQAPCPEANIEATQYVTAWWVFTYDGDGNRVSQMYNSGSTTETTAYFMGGLYEETVETSTVRKYYAISGMTVAMSDAEGIKYLLTDHLGSVTAVTDDNGALLSQQRYKPFGAVRENIPQPIPNSPITQTDFGYTGQRDITNTGLMDYKARAYDPLLMRFIQPDTIIPDFADPQSWNRYSYVLNNPANHTDPTGHQLVVPVIESILIIAAVATLTTAVVYSLEFAKGNKFPGLSENLFTPPQLPKNQKGWDPRTAVKVAMLLGLAAVHRFVTRVIANTGEPNPLYVENLVGNSTATLPASVTPGLQPPYAHPPTSTPFDIPTSRPPTSTPDQPSIPKEKAPVIRGHPRPHGVME